MDGHASIHGQIAETLLRTPGGETQKTFAGFPLVSAKQDYALHLIFTLDPANPAGRNLVEIVLTPRDDGRPALARTASFNLDFKGPMTGSSPAPAVKPLVDEVIAVIQRNDSGGHLIPQPPSQDGKTSEEEKSIHRAVAWIGIALVVLFLGLLPWTGKWVLVDLMESLGSRPWLIALLLVAAVGLVLRLAVPHLPVMYYMGYRLAQDAASLDYIPKYGSGALAFYHLLFQVTGTSHLAMAYANSVLGAFMPLAGAALAARMGAPRITVLTTAALLSLAPVFIRDASTESILVPTVLWTLLGLQQFLKYRETRQVSMVAVGWVHILLALYSRPEAVVLPAFCLILLWRCVPGASSKRSAAQWILLVGTLVAAHALIILRVSHLNSAMDLEFARGNTPVLRDPVALLSLAPEFLTRNLVFKPGLFPVGFLVLAAAALLTRATRWKAIALMTCASAWLAVALVDLPYVSIARVQVPGAVFLTIAAGLGAGALWELFSRWSAKDAARRIPGAAVALLVLASMVTTVPGLWAKTNPDDEEKLLRETRERLPDGPAILVRRSYEDQPEERLHLYYPDYWFNGGKQDVLVVGPDWFAGTDTAGRPAYFLLGTRCYMRKCGEEGMHPACRKILDGYRLEPVIERTVPVRHLPVDRKTRHDQELDFPWCLSVEREMKLGLYRIGDRTPATSAGSGS